ncbi:flightin [Venturia canescens]|uniref:flightin n=1 Tax=Venturia canescens TaxID=32260 RepID=UPI001C9BCDF9|nr:flightin [Venturia canescens]
MADDEPAAWDLDDLGTEETPAETVETPAAPAAPADGKKAEKVEKPRLDISGFPKAPKPKYTLHWVRPLFLNYRYLYDYRQNYYNDVMDWLDKKERGVWREEPRAQEWGERMFRTAYEKNVNKSFKRTSDLRWIEGYRTVPQHYSYHTRAYYSLKYMKIL